MKTLSRTFTVLVLLLFLSPTLQAGWQLVNEASLLAFVTIKKNSKAEVGHFKQLRGVIHDDGQVSIEINLASVDTKIPVRDERIREKLFETGAFPSALLESRVNMEQIGKLAPGEATTTRVKLKLSLHGRQKELEAVLHVTALKGGKLLVHSVAAVIVDAADFGLKEGIDTLRSIAKLPSIATAVPVTVSLVFQKL